MGHHIAANPNGMVAAMVTKIRRGTKPRPYLKEHRKAARLSATAMAGRLEVERESVYRYERQPLKMSLERLDQWAEACGLDSYRDLFRLPHRQSVDEIIEDLPDDLQGAVIDLAVKMAARGR